MNGIQRKLRVWMNGLGGLLLMICLGSMHAGATTYYVTTSGNDGNSGTSEGSAWRHIAHAAQVAQAGDTVRIKAGSYGNEKAVVAHSGTSGSPIIFEGYGGTVQMGTLPSPWDANHLPPSDLVGFNIQNHDYITIRNINFTYYYTCIQTYEANHLTLDNLYIDKCGSSGSSGYGIWIYYSDYVTVTDCTVRDCGGDNVMIDRSSYAFFDNLQTLGTLSGTHTYATDYYCVLRRADHCTIQNSLAEDTVDSTKGNHGFIIKDGDYTPNSHDNLIQDCTAISFEECFSVAHYAYNNTFLRCTANNTAKTNTINSAFMVRNCAHDNTFQDCDATGRRVLVALTSYNENGHTGNKDGNQFINCRLRGIDQSDSMGILFWDTSDTVFQNCVFDKVHYFARYVGTNTGTIVKNCIINGIPVTYDPNVIDTGSTFPYGNYATPYNGTNALTTTYCDFYNCTFGSFGSIGILTANPLFADQPNGDYHLKSTAGRWNGSGWVLDSENSPCIDAGDPESPYDNEPEDNGGRINIGRYGNTDEASKTASGEEEVMAMDNRLREVSPDTAYPTNTFLDVGHLTSSNSRFRDILWFDLVPYGDDPATSITNATLSMYWYYPTSARTNDTVVDVYKPASGWSHDYASWNKKTSSVNWTNAGGDWTDANNTSQGTTPFASVTFDNAQNATSQYYDWDVTQLVRSIITAGVNPGFLIKAHTESDNYIAFYGSANASNRPKLSITRMASQSEPLAYDNRLKQSDPNTVLGTSTFSDVGALSGNNYRDLIWFDLSPYQDVETVTKATLSLYWYYPAGTTRTNDTIVDIYRPAAGWTRTGACWNYKASGVSWTNAGGDWYDATSTAQGSTPFASITFPAGTTPTNQYYQFDVTALVNYYRSTGTNAGFFIKARTESNNYIAFYSLNNTAVSTRPKLEITTTIQQ